MKKNKKSETKNSTKVANKSKKIEKKSGAVENGVHKAVQSKIKKLKTPIKDELNAMTQGRATQPELSEKNLAKIAKKAAKKLAQRIKKKQNKALKNDKVVTKHSSEEQPKIITSAENKTHADDQNDAKKLTKKQLKLEKKEKLKQPSKEVEKAATVSVEKDKQADNQNDAKKLTKKQLKLEKKEKLKQSIKDQGSQRDPAVEKATVFVGNLPINTKRVQLTRLFEPYGPVQTIRFRTAAGNHIFKHKDRLKAGSLNAYVILPNASNVERALELNGNIFKGNHLRVTYADKNSHNRGDLDAKRTIFIGNLKYSVTDDNLREIFSSCGDIEYVRCLRDGEKGCKGVAYVCFKASDAVGLALELNGTILEARPIHVERYSAKKLGAKKQRDAATEAEKNSTTGAKRRLKENQSNETKTNGKDDALHKKKKAEFRGVKVGGIEKKSKTKKKTTSQMEKLAQKIAPRPKATD